MSTLADLYAALEEDTWRQEVPFSPELLDTHRLVFNNELSDKELEIIVRQWLQKHQPCLFGRIAAKFDLLMFCFLRQQDIEQSDEYVRDKIQRARSAWTREAYEGRKSGFVIMTISERLALAKPSTALKDFATRLCSLYLLTDIQADQIYTDDIFLERPGPARVTWKWNVGANYFAANADGRWWRDHRIPGGIGFSMNSVGHMVKSGLIAAHLAEMAGVVGGPDEQLVTTKVDSLPKALEIAMRTIWLAAETPSGRATELIPFDKTKTGLQCPIKLPAFLEDKDFTTYIGYYHTDVTIPSEYFLPDIGRPPGIVPKRLDFSYLFDPSLGNPDFMTTGEGRRIRAINAVQTATARDKRMKSIPQTVGSEHVTKRIL
jgi:hypothetical protein